MKTGILCLVVGLVAISAVFQAPFFAQPQNAAWRNIQLLRATPADVEKLLKQPSQSSGYTRYYSLPNYELWIDYYPFDHCNPRYDKVGEWNVPEWTVTEILYVPEGSVVFSSLKLDLKKFRKVHESPHVPAMISYIDDRNGVDYTLNSDGKTLYSIRYFPSPRKKRLRCPQNKEANR